ncbi:LysE family transporter [Crenobacter sp. SG2305]|uniref:LysE family transporter n=1 Tax=Crenobacter oryzisoli TaxID=3056844 RepID=UPI0025AA8350|nr:LysE family transporter [Crenobacter sp. SG2305]MDN0081282.1 LysE family transporter [Crenobacter sp. SG2305]
MSGVALFSQALLVGWAIAAPVGPIGLLVIERTLRYGRAAGLVTGLGAASADALYATVGVAGLGMLTAWLTRLALPLALFGSGFLIWLGVATLRRAPAERAAAGAGAGLAGYAVSAFALTLSNPLTVLSFVAVFAGLAGRQAPGAVAGVVMIAGVFCGSVLWWLMLAGTVGWLGGKLSTCWRRRIDTLCGLLLLGFGVALGVRALLG